LRTLDTVEPVVHLLIALGTMLLLAARCDGKKGSFLSRGMTAVFAVAEAAEAPVSVDTLVIPASFVPRVIVGRVRCRAS